MADLDCRILGMLALSLSLLSLTAVIFVRHHPHHYNPSALRLTSESENDYPDDNDGEPTTSNKFKKLAPATNGTTFHCSGSSSNQTSAASQDSQFPFHISAQCLQCICEASTECKPSKCSSGEMCGLFRISHRYWMDAGVPTIHGQQELVYFRSYSDTKKEYLLCVNDPCCAARTVSGLIDKFINECVNTVVNGCRDYATIHYQYHAGCMLKELPKEYSDRLERCLRV